MPETDTLAAAREAAGYDQETAANAVGLSASTLSRLENGLTKRMDAIVATNLAKLYGLTFERITALHALAVASVATSA